MRMDAGIGRLAVHCSPRVQADSWLRLQEQGTNAHHHEKVVCCRWAHMKAGNVARGAPLAGGVSIHSPQDPRRGAGEPNTQAHSLGIQTGIHLAFNGHSMGQIWHSGLFGSVEPYFSWTATDRFPGGNFLIIILEGAKEHRRPRMGCTHGPGSRSLPEFHGPRRARDF